LDGGVSPKVWTVTGVFNAFLDVWTVKHILFDCNYDLGLVLGYK